MSLSEMTQSMVPLRYQDYSALYFFFFFVLRRSEQMGDFIVHKSILENILYSILYCSYLYKTSLCVYHIMAGDLSLILYCVIRLTLLGNR